MLVKEIMTQDPACCEPDTSVPEIARMMKEQDCGSIPVVEGEDHHLVGIVTDRDIACRLVAEGKDPARSTARDCMSNPITTVDPEDNLEECCRTMEEQQIRRVPVVDRSGVCCGIVSQADIAELGSIEMTADVVREISQPALGSARR